MKKQYQVPMGYLLICEGTDIICTSGALNHSKSGVGDVIPWDEI